jgi:hypothetical protein
VSAAVRCRTRTGGRRVMWRGSKQNESGEAEERVDKGAGGWIRARCGCVSMETQWIGEVACSPSV